MRMIKAELSRLFRSRIALAAFALIILSPFLGYQAYRPLLSLTQDGYTTSRVGMFLANQALAGTLFGSVIVAFLTVYEMEYLHKYRMDTLLEPVLSPKKISAVQCAALILFCVAAQAAAMAVHLPFTYYNLGHTFDMGLYIAVWLVFMLPCLIFGVLISSASYQFVKRLDLALALFIVLTVLSLVVWNDNYLLRWINPSVWVMSDDFGNSRLLMTVLYNRLFWMLIISGMWLISFLCVRSYGKGAFKSFLHNSRRLIIPAMAVILFVSGGTAYAKQPFLDHSKELIDYDTYYGYDYNEDLICDSVYVYARPDVKLGRMYGSAKYHIKNSGGEGQEALFRINPGYKVFEIKANGEQMDFKDLNNDDMNTKEISVILPPDKEIELEIEYGGLPQEWNILETMQGAMEISRDYICLVNEDFCPVPKNTIWDVGSPSTLESDIIIPEGLTPVMFDRGEITQGKKLNDGSVIWNLKTTGYYMKVYAGTYVSEHIDAGKTQVDFYYSQRQQEAMERMNVTQAHKDVFTYCTEKYGPLSFYGEDGSLKLIELNAYQGGGYAGNGASVMDENCFNEGDEKNKYKGASQSEVMAHEIIHQWWGLGNMFESEDYNDEWSSEGLTVYTTYRLMKELHGEEYAVENYVRLWEKTVEEYNNNFYVRHPEYLEKLPEKYRVEIANSLSGIKHYSLMPLKILKAEKLVGGEEKMDEILASLFQGETNPSYPYLTYEAFLDACGLSKEDLNLE